MSASSRIVKIRGDLDRDAFGAKIGVSGRTVQRWELNNELPKGKEVVKIAEIFNVNAHWLLTGQGDPYIKDRARGSPHEIVSEPDSPYGTAASGATDADFQVDVTHSIEMLMKIIGSKNQTLVRAILSNLEAFTEAVDQKNRMDLMDEKINALAAKLNTFEELQQQNNSLRKEVNRLRAIYENPEDAPDTEEKAS
jgi:transcriptional regulator with XRE-family HTH domain